MGIDEDARWHCSLCNKLSASEGFAVQVAPAPPAVNNLNSSSHGISAKLLVPCSPGRKAYLRYTNHVVKQVCCLCKDLARSSQACGV